MKQKPGSGQTPGGKPNLERLEDYVSRVLCRKETIGSGARGRKKSFGGSELFGVVPIRKEHPEQQEAPKMWHQMLDSLEGYLKNISAAATQTMATGGPLAELEEALHYLWTRSRDKRSKSSGSQRKLML